MTTRIHRLLAACAAAAIVVPTVALAQQPTMLQLYNLNGSAVGGRWLVRPPALPNTGGPYTITLPDASGTLLTGSGTANRMTRWTGTGTLGNGSLDDDASGTLSRAGNININPGGANTLATNGNLSAGGGLTITGASNLNGSATIGNGDDNVAINAGGANTFQLTSNGLNVATSGDLSDAGGAVVINDLDGLDLNTNLILNVGNAGTDFTAGGGLTLAGALLANGAATLGDGADNITINAGAANTFQLTSSGLVVATSGDISDAGGAVVIADAQGLDMSNNVIANIGAAGTDFSGTGGLTLADVLTVSAGGASITGATTITGATNINNSPAALTTTIGNNTLNNILSIDAQTVNIPNILPYSVGATNTFLMRTATNEIREYSVTGTVSTGSGTANRMTRWTGANTLGDATLSDDGAGVLSRAGSFQLNPGTGNTISTDGSVNISAVTNQLELGAPGAGNSITITAPAPGGDRTYTIPDAGADAQFVLTEGTQTVNANLTLTGEITASSAVITGASPLVFDGSSPADLITTTFAIADPTGTSKTITFPNSTGTVAVGVYAQETLTGNGTDVSFPIANTTVTANSIILVTLEDDPVAPTDVNFYDFKISNRIAGVGFNIDLSAPIANGDTKIVNYTIINP